MPNWLFITEKSLQRSAYVKENDRLKTKFLIKARQCRLRNNKRRSFSSSAPRRSLASSGVSAKIADVINATDDRVQLHSVESITRTQS